MAEAFDVRSAAFYELIPEAGTKPSKDLTVGGLVTFCYGHIGVLLEAPVYVPPL